MNIFVSGISYRHTPVAIREKLSFSNSEEISTALNVIRQIPAVTECALLSTCNRTEIYLFAEAVQFDLNLINGLLCRLKGVDHHGLTKYFYAYHGLKAIKHIFKVAAAMDSMIIGEDQILGQFKDASQISIEAGTSAAVLNTLLRKAVTAAKAIKTSQARTLNRSGIAAATRNLIMNVFKENSPDQTALIIGSGKVGLQVASQLVEMGLKKVLLACRKYCHIEVPHQVKLIDYEKRYEFLQECEILISATRSPHYTITSDLVEKHLKEISGSRAYIDLAVPRDIDPQVANLKNISYFNIDDHQEIFRLDSSTRLFDHEFYEAVIKKNINDFKKWFYFREAIFDKNKGKSLSF